MGMWNRWRQWTEAEGPLVGLAFFRIVLGFMLWRHAWAFVRKYADDGFYRAKFYVPYWDWYPLPSETAYLLVVALMMIAGFLIIIGYRTRWALVIALAAAGFHLFLNQYWYSNNRYFMLLSLLLLSVSPCGRELSLDAAKQKQKGWGPIWTFTLIRLQMTLIYLASATSKILDADWRSGRVLWDRRLDVAEWLSQMDRVPDILTALLSNRTFFNTLTALVLGTECFLTIGLWLPWTRRFAIWVGLIFHGYIEVGDRVLAFSYLSLGTYFLVISPHQQKRIFYYNPQDAHHRFWARWTQRLDWFDKIKLATHDSPTLRIQDTDGGWYQGWMAVCIAGAALILPYLIAYPITWLRFLGVGRVEPWTDSQGKTGGFQPLMGHSRARLVLIILLCGYVGFLWIITTVPSLHMGFDAAKFVDIPVMFLIFALTMAACPKPAMRI
ncbi:MAG: HTTM domain-containing protein [Candidatus Poribacteria bacterium]|nr:HTTM domain-containing protein [Candidatus Poribacteria bacterium]